MDKTIYLVANSHIDPVWLWDKYEGIDEVINTFRAACDRLDEYPDLRFTISSICFLKWTHQFAPDVFARIQAHVAGGRWEIAGGWWIEPDCNLPTAKSFQKSHEVSRRFLEQHFPGVAVEVGYCPDSFGHQASLPAILAEQGLKYYVFCRPGELEKTDLPDNLFYWEHDGRRVLCYRLRYYYSQGTNPNFGVAEKALADDDFVKHGLASYFFGVGDHGGGPTRREIEFWQQKQAEVQNRCLRFSTALEFFRAAEKVPNIPAYRGDLHFHAVGCYSVNRGLKHAIRTAERGLDYTERVNGLAGRSTDLAPLWEKTIFNQFHDVMPGSCAPRAYQQALGEMGGVHDKADWEAYEALKRIAGRTPVRHPQGEFRLLNTLDHPVTGPFEIESWLYYHENATFRDDAGRAIPIQQITPSVICANRRWVFVDTIPARTEKAYSFDNDTPDALGHPALLFGPGESIARENMAVHAGSDPPSLTLSPQTSVPITLAVVPDTTDTWSHGVRGFGEAEGAFITTESSVATGPIASTLVVRQAYSRSTAELTFRIYNELPWIDLFLRVHWAEYRSLLKLILTPPAALDHVFAQGAGAAWLKRVQGMEEPLHGWLQAGPLAILQDGAFAFDWSADRLRLTLVRSSLFAYHDPHDIDPRGPLHPTDMGEHHFGLRFLSAPGLDAAALDRRFADFIEPFRVLRQNQ